MKRWLLIALLALTGPAHAQQADAPLRPMARGEAQADAPDRPMSRPAVRISSKSPLPDLRPLARPLPEPAPTPARIRPSHRPPSPQVIAAAARAPDMPLLGPNSAWHPILRPPELIEKVMAKRRARRKGAVCGDLDIQGEKVGYVPGRIKACGIKDAVRVRAVSGVGLTTQSLMNCRTAKALKTWVDKGIKPAFKSQGGVAKLKVAAHYSCRTRNNRPGAKISEHGKGNAIDISGFILNNGEVVTVLSGWRGKASKALKRVHKAACGPFGTVLGPNSDAYHRDHFHVDTARYRSGLFCR